MTDGNIVSQNVETQTVLDNNIEIQVAQEVQEQITVGVPGPRGPVGPMGSGVAWRGAYDPTTDYELRDAVVYLGSSYACFAPCTGIAPTETSNWELVAAKGDTGADGVSDIPGPRGYDGTPGAKGDTGITGAPGEQGVQGIQGIQGSQGETGVQGIQGVKGDTGADSTVAGPKGDTGDAGPTGDAFVYADFTEGELAVLVGPQGEQGIQGNAGAAGQNGAAGAKGDTGLTGSAGADGVDGVTPVKGVDYFDGADGEQGIQGETGSQGIQGIQGVKGDTGNTGAAGAKGDTGDTGAAGTTTWAGITDKPATFTPAAHNQALATISDVTCTAAEINKLAGLTTTAAELVHVHGVTSAIQTQLAAKVVGPASATDNAIVRFDAATGKLVQNSGVIISDAGAISDVTTGMKLAAPYKQTFVNLSTTPVSCFGGMRMDSGGAILNFRLTSVENSFCTFQIFMGLWAGHSFNSKAVAGANCSITGTGSYAIVGPQDGRTYTLAIDFDGYATFSVSSATTGNTILQFVGSN